MLERLIIEVDLDGSAYRNPGHEGGIAALANYSDGRPPRIIFKEGFDGTTNNRMELRAAIKAIEHARVLAKKEEVESLLIRSDSKYLCENFPRTFGWRSRGWENAEGRILENKDLWKKLLSLREWSGIRFTIEYHKGKQTSDAKTVDKKAKEAAKGWPRRGDIGYIKPKVSRSKSGGRDPSTMFPAQGGSEIIRIYEYERLKSKHKEEYRIKFDLFSIMDSAYVDKCFVYMAVGDKRLFHRNHCYSATFNTNPLHPVIEELKEIACPVVEVVRPQSKISAT